MIFGGGGTLMLTPTFTWPASAGVTARPLDTSASVMASRFRFGIDPSCTLAMLSKRSASRYAKDVNEFRIGRV
jgi:hypothetical protein